MTGVNFVFHATALKQIRSCEFFPIEALKTNGIGTENVLNTAINSGVKRVIILSTDKAVYPINAMGISKAMMEEIGIAKSRIAGEDIQQRGGERGLQIPSDYHAENVSEKVVRIIMSYTEYINRTVWKKGMV